MRPLLILLLIAFNCSLFAQGKTTKPYLICIPDPQFPGGDTALMNFIRANLKYPKFAEENQIQGRVVVGFKVLADGSLSNVEVVRHLQADLDKEALRVVKLLNFIPLKEGDIPRTAPYVIPIEFKLN